MVAIRKQGGAQMTPLHSFRRLLLAAVVGVSSGCAVGVGYPGYGGGGNYPTYEYYEPDGYEYGDWGAGYRVGPRWSGRQGGERHEDARSGGDHHDESRGGGDARGGNRPGADRGNNAASAARPYRPAPPNRAVPSIPAHARKR